MAGIQQLQVYLGDRHIGTLSQSQGRLSFQYEQGWLSAPQSHPLSLSLPLRQQPFDDQQTRIYFGNLLPEGDVLQTVARRLGRSSADIFGLLVDLGGECAGAVSLLPPEQTPTNAGQYQLFSEEELFRLVSENSSTPLLAGETGIRLSLAGAQNKVPVYVDERGIYKAVGTFATTHILKPPIRAAIPLPHTVINEAFCMNLAGRLGLNVPRSEINAVRHQSFYLVERFDRRREGEQIVRLHQEDFCQALGIEANLKYEESGGPSLADIWHVLRDHSRSPAMDGRQLLRWTGFNFLLGNADAHAKNIALLYSEDGSVRLAPFYDLLCTAIYPGLDQRLALRLGGERHPDRLRRQHWEHLAEELQITVKAVLGELQRLVEQIEPTAESLAKDYVSRYDCSETMVAILDIVRRRTSRAWAFLGGRPN